MTYKAKGCQTVVCVCKKLPKIPRISVIFQPLLIFLVVNESKVRCKALVRDSLIIWRLFWCLHPHQSATLIYPRIFSLTDAILNYQGNFRAQIRENFRYNGFSPPSTMFGVDSRSRGEGWKRCMYESIEMEFFAILFFTRTDIKEAPLIL